MDPNANLAELRTLVATNIGLPVIDRHAMARMMELVDALDTWISQGGFLPTEWRP